MKKNVLLASAVLMMLGMAGNVHADEKVVSVDEKVSSEKTNTTVVTDETSSTVKETSESKAAVEEPKAATVVKKDAEKTSTKETSESKVAVEEPKTTTVVKKDAEKTPTKAAAKPADKTETEELDAEIAELEKAAGELEAATNAVEEEAHEAQILEWAETLTDLFAAMENMEFTEEFNAEDFLKAFYFDVIDLKKEIQQYIAENGSSNEAKTLLDGLNEYLNEVGPAMKQLNVLVTKYNAGQLTEEEFLAAVDALFDGETSQNSAPKAEVAPVEKKTEATPAPVEKQVETKPVEVKPTAEPEVSGGVGTLPETGSDAKAFISVIGAALAGLTLWGFGFKNRG